VPALFDEHQSAENSLQFSYGRGYFAYCFTFVFLPLLALAKQGILKFASWNQGCMTASFIARCLAGMQREEMV
jgi:hypothetical protein